jgi:hypothetical protein
MYRVLMSYLERLPGTMQEKELPSGEKIQECVLLAASAAGDHRDAAAVSAMLDRLLHHGHLLKCGPRSWGTKTGLPEGE